MISKGPDIVCQVYKPDHHSDFSFSHSKTCSLLLIHELYLALEKNKKLNHSVTILVTIKVNGHNYQTFLHDSYKLKWTFTYVTLPLQQQNTTTLFGICIQSFAN